MGGNEGIIRGNESTIQMFRSFGARVRELRESRAIDPEQTYRRTIRQFAKELVSAKEELERLQSHRSNMDGGTVTREQLEEASIRLTLAKKVMEEIGVSRSNIELLLG